MAVINSNGTGGGNYGAPSTWAGGVVPGNMDEAVIQATDDVLFVNEDDTAGIDQSGLANGVIYTVNGNLRFSTAPNRVSYLKHYSTKNFAGTGWLYIGNSLEDPIPRSSSVTVYLTTGDFGIVLTHFRAYGYFFADRQFTTLSAGYAIGATEIVLSQDLDLQANDQIAIGSSNCTGGMTTAQMVYTVQAYNAGTKTVTLTGGLAGYARASGDYVMIISRNINMLRQSNQNSYLMGTHDAIMYGVRWGNGTVAFRAYSGGSTTYSPLIAYCTGYGNASYVGIAVNNEGVIKHSNFYGSGQWHFNLNNTGAAYRCCSMNNGRGMGSGGWLLECVGQNNSNSIVLASDGQLHVQNCVFKNNGSDLNGHYNGDSRFFNNYYSNTINISNRGDTSKSPNMCVELIGINGVPTAYRCYTRGGYGVTQSTVQYNSIDTLQFVCQDAARAVFRDYYLYLKGGSEFTAKVQCQKSFAGANVCGLMILDMALDPLMPFGFGHQPLVEAVKADDTDTWEQLTVNYTPPSNGMVIVRVWAKAASGNAYFYTKDIEELLPPVPLEGGDTIIYKRPIYML